MKLSAIALKNLKRNFSFYSLYLFSVSFVLMIYFCFTSFSMNQVIMEKISSDGRVETMCQTVAVFIMAFVIFYMFSNHWEDTAEIHPEMETTFHYTMLLSHQKQYHFHLHALLYCFPQLQQYFQPFHRK